MLLILLPALAIHRLDPETRRRRSFAPLALSEKFLIAYVVISIVSLAANHESLGLRLVVSSAEKQLAFLILYFSARDYLTRGDYRVLGRGIVVLAVISAMVAILQYIWDPQFFRVGDSFRGAFGDVGRSTGVFKEEYEHAMYVTFVAIAVGLWGRGRPLWQWMCLTLLLGISVVVTFQRMPWAAFLFAVLCVLVIRWWNNPRWRHVGVVVGSIVLVLMIWVPWWEPVLRSLPERLLTDRLSADTLTIRQAFNEFAVWLIPRYPLGLGDTVASPIYNQEFYNYGLSLRSSGVGYTVHNGFLSAAVRYGIAGGLAFGCMLFGFLFVSARRAAVSNAETFILPLLAIVLILYNLTEDFSSAGGQTILIAGLLMGCFVGQNLYRSASNNQNTVPADAWIKSKPGDRVVSDA